MTERGREEMDIRNESQLKIAVLSGLEKAIEKVSEKVSEKLKAQIRTDVFTTPNSWYERTGEFEESFKWDSIKKGISSVAREMAYDPSGLRYDGKKWIHGNPGKSAVDNLADILNLAYNNYKPGYASGLKFGNRHFSHFRRPYWNNLMEFLFDKGNLNKWIIDELKSQGFKIVK